MAKVIREGLEAKLAALDGAEWDSMSDDSMGEDDEVPELGDAMEASGEDRLEKAPLPLRAGGKKKKEEGKQRKASVVPVGMPGQPSGVIYIGHIPHGFYEEAMNGFFNQFGDVVRVRISRSGKSGRSKGYAYVEFSSPDVAGIVAETMNGYYLSNKQLVCRVLNFDEIHANLFDGAGAVFKKVNWHGIYREKYNKDRTQKKDKEHAKKLVVKDKAKRSKLAALGIDYEFPGFVASLKNREVAEGPYEKPGSAGKEEAKAKGPASKKRKSSDTAAPATPSSPSKKTKGDGGDKGKERGKKKTPVKGEGETLLPAVANSAEKTSSKGKEKTPVRTPAKSPSPRESGSEGAGVGVEAGSTGKGSDKKKAAKTPRRNAAEGAADASSAVATPAANGAKAEGGSKGKGSSSKRKTAKSPAPVAVAAAAAGTAATAAATPTSSAKKAKSPKGGKKKAPDDAAMGAGAPAPDTRAVTSTATPTSSGKKGKSPKSRNKKAAEEAAGGATSPATPSHEGKKAKSPKSSKKRALDDTKGGGEAAAVSVARKSPKSAKRSRA